MDFILTTLLHNNFSIHIYPNNGRFGFTATKYTLLNLDEKFVYAQLPQSGFAQGA
jgi:hypothetical protein